MQAAEAQEILAARQLAVAAEGTAVEVRALLVNCLENEIPAIIGPCPKSG